MSRETLKKLLILPPLAVGVIVLLLAIKDRPAPEKTMPKEAIATVRVIQVPSVTVVPRALGYGYVQPGRVWEAVAQVGGQVVDIHPQLKKGAIIGRGEILLRIDPTDYRLAAAQIEASLRSVQAQLAELEAKGKNTWASLAIEEASLALSRKDLDRKRRLLEKRNVPQAAVDEEERNVLARRLNVQSLKNTLNLIPAERDNLKAQKAQHQAHLDAALLDLERTIVVAPFDSRIAEVAVELTQFAAQGKVLVVLDDIGVSEVTAQVPIGKLANLVPPGKRIPTHAAEFMKSLPGLLNLSATVRLRSGNLDAQWEARFTRISDTVDPQTRTVGVIVAVDDPYQKAVLGERPPLTKNMFVEVELRGAPRPDQLVIPRAALHDGRVYVVNGDSRLQRRSIQIAFLQTNFAVIKGGLKAGERVIISDLIPAIDGMLLHPVADNEALTDLIADARGEGPVK